MDPLLVLVVMGVAPLPFKADESGGSCQHGIQFFNAEGLQPVTESPTCALILGARITLRTGSPNLIRDASSRSGNYAFQATDR